VRLCLCYWHLRRLTSSRGINVGSKLDLENLNRAVTANGLGFTDVIDRTFPFGRAEEAFDYVLSGKQVGKVVIEMEKAPGA
jgi:NADPH:quinone reductase-like Zn-dependent oxidoreductase